MGETKNKNKIKIKRKELIYGVLYLGALPILAIVAWHWPKTLPFFWWSLAFITIMLHFFGSDKI